jgi:microcompartment protein CcmK/EutM
LVQELLAARLVAVLATFDVSGPIHSVPMWCAADEESVLLATGSLSRKVQNLERDSRATLVLHDSRPGFEVCGASIVGRVHVVHGSAARPLIQRVHRRYVHEQVEQHEVVRDFLASDDVALRFRPESALIWDERGSAANEALRAMGAALPLAPTDPRA